MILLDTHVLVWYWMADDDLGKKALEIVDRAWRDNDAAVSAITFWELTLLQRKNRLSLRGNLRLHRHSLLQQGLNEIAISGDIAAHSQQLENFHPDPADRIIAASALEGHQLMTADQLLLNWTGPLDCLDARR